MNVSLFRLGQPQTRHSLGPKGCSVAPSDPRTDACYAEAPRRRKQGRRMTSRGVRDAGSLSPTDVHLPGPPRELTSRRSFCKEAL